MEKFKSKIDLWLVLFLSIVLGFATITMLKEQHWAGSIVLLCTIAFIIHIFATTFYTIENGKLLIKSGFLVHILITVDTIKKISETNNILSSPALSFDRLEIFYNNSDSVLISPKDKVRFIDAIQKINSQVEIKRKKNF